jgi:hypothetical protein
MSATEETVQAAIAPVTETPSVSTEAAAPQAPSPENLERDEKGKFRNPLQPRIDELTRARREAEREAAFWRSRAEAPASEPKPEKPTADKFETYDAYVEALADWKADEKVDAKFEARDKASAERATAEKRASTWSERKAAFATEMPDNDAVMEASEVPIALHVAEGLLESEEGPRIARHLNDNPDIAEKLNAMTPTQAAREIGRLEVMLKPASAPPVPEVQAQPPADKRPTKAPPPVKPIAQSKSASVDLAKASMDEYVEQRRKQGASWARR